MRVSTLHQKIDTTIFPYIAIQMLEQAHRVVFHFFLFSMTRYTATYLIKATQFR